MVLVLCEMQSVSSRIWTRVAVSISYDDNNYTTGMVHFSESDMKIKISGNVDKSNIYNGFSCNISFFFK